LQHELVLSGSAKWSFIFVFVCYEYQPLVFTDELE
jgi:hypothetical protein